MVRGRVGWRDVGSWLAAFACLAAPAVALAEPEKKLAPPGIEAVGPTAVQVTSWAPGLLCEISRGHPWCSKAAQISLALRDADGTEKTLHTVDAFVSLAQKAGDRFVQRPAPALRITRDDRDLMGEVLLAADRTTHFTVIVGGISGAGVYEAKLHLPVKGRQSLDVAHAIVVREPFWYALVLIALGVYASHRLRVYLGTGRQRLLWLRDVRRVKERLDEQLRAADLTMSERAVGGSLRTQVVEVEDGLSFNPKREKIEETIGVLQAKLALYGEWIAAEREARAPELVQERDRLRADLDQAAQIIRREDATKALVEERRKKVQDLAVGPARRAAIRKGIEQLRAEIASHREGADVNLEVSAAFKEVETSLRDVERALDDASADRVTEAADAFGVARIRFARALLTELEKAIERARPPGFEEDGWKALVARYRARVARARAMTAAEDVLAEHEDAQRDFVLELAAAVEERAGETLKGDTKRPALEQVRAQAKSARELVAKHDFLGAMEACQKAAAYENDAARASPLEALADPDEEVAFAPGAKIAAAPRLRGARSAWLRALVPAVGIGLGDAPPPAALDPIARVVTSRDVAVNVALGIIAVASGLNALWIPNESWGGSAAYLLALLWGFGLHQLGSGPFEGLLGLREKLSKIGG